MNKQEIQQQALANARGNQSLMNYGPIFEGFMAKGIPEALIAPRENVFTYNAWLALGRQVRKGEHGIKVVTFIECTEKQAQRRANTVGQTVQVERTETGKVYRRPWSTTVFHISQTDPIEPELDATDENIDFAGEGGE